MSEFSVDTQAPVLVAGASGFVGSHTARLLCEQGRRVRVMLRKSSDTSAIADLPVEIVYGDVLDVPSLKAAMQGCQSVFYSVVDPRFWLSDPAPIYRNNVDGLVNAMEVALTLGVSRFIFTSTMGTLGINPDGPVTEDIEFNWLDKAPPYIKARLKAEQEFLRYCREKSLPGVALCVANTYGPHDYQPTPHGKMLWDIAEGRVGFTMGAGAPTVDIRDVAIAAVAAETKGKLGERYIIANEFISNRDFAALAAAEGGHKPPKVIPMWFAYCMVGLIQAIMILLRRKDYIVRTSAVYLSNVFQEMDHSKAGRDLDWQPRPIKQTIKDAAAWYATRPQPEK
ncbi:NAD-dependent epimerase/dehydratase family protein [Zhongshania aquimaris]|uniref:NAD-dependent epimerase/dehydratase family protein n=1 Tax=Zhongshania aquimaris TaxID=2857107 RepID=A0ABS6VXW9_9GAMM|nr:NAD-dependent epimerase/dehydratase family protein [Zhongshania aquimaris]MBW2942491.1 NAD-dependent epimerase/dehydratase family protein [Zhongshania aquimaris]